MNEDFSEYKDLIRQIAAAPRVNPPLNLTQRVMGQLADEQRFSIWQLLRRTIKQAGEISWARFASADTKAQDACFYFLITGFFFFFVGSVLFTSAFYIGYAPRATGFILLHSILVLVAAISLIMGGMIIAADTPGFALWAKRAIIVYGVLMILSSVLIAAAVKTTLGGLLSLTFGMAVIVMGVTLSKALENRTQGSSSTFRRELHNV